MIRVFLSQKEDEYCVKMEGHAGYCPGNDIVCAGASAIVYALAGYLKNAGEHVTTVAEERLHPGDAEIRFRGDAYAGEAFKATCVGLMQLEKQFPLYVSIKK